MQDFHCEHPHHYRARIFTEESSNRLPELQQATDSAPSSAHQKTIRLEFLPKCVRLKRSIIEIQIQKLEHSMIGSHYHVGTTPWPQSLYRNRMEYAAYILHLLTLLFVLQI